MTGHGVVFPLFALALVGVGLSMGCDAEEGKSMVVDAMVDMGPECMLGPDGQQTCKTRYGDNYFCTDELRCAELAPCETVDCCSPGDEGDLYCVNLCQYPDNCPAEVANFGPGSVCAAREGNGSCTERACIGCTYDNPGHGCCAEALGESWFCGGDGRCVESQACAQEDCCVPGAAGDANCAEAFGMGSTCTLVGGSGQCLRSAPPPCAGCEPSDEGHACCSGEFGELWFCSLEGICRSASGCQTEECCVPGGPGDTLCRSRFGEASSCDIVERDGRCVTPM